MPTLPPRLSRLALVLVDTSILDLLNLVSSTAETLETLSLMGIFITDDDLKASPLDKRGALRTESLKKSLVAPRVRSLSFGRVVSLRGGGGAAASPAAVGALLRFLLNAQSPTITDLCLQASESFTSADLVSLLDSEERPRSLVNLLWWHPDEIQSQQMQQAQQTANGAPPPAANRQPGGPEGNHIVSVPHEEAGHSLAIEDEGVKAACVRYGIRWLKSLTPLLLDSLVHDSI